MAESADVLQGIGLFAGLDAAGRTTLLACMRRRDLERGGRLVRQGEPADSLFILLHGALAVVRSGDPSPIAEIRAGEIVGEIGFFTGGTRTADVVARRDCALLELNRDAWAQVVARLPEVTSAVIAALGRRLAATTALLPAMRRQGRDRAVALLPAGTAPLPPDAMPRLVTSLRRHGAVVLDRAAIASRFPGWTGEGGEVAAWLNGLEQQHGLVVLVGDDGPGDWTRLALRQADLAVFVAVGACPDGPLTALEAFACGLHPPEARRLVRIHSRRQARVQGTPAWLKRLPCFLHHQAALEDDADFDRVARFLAGRAVGFVAGGGGAYGPAHLGIYQAFRDRGVVFDMFVGTSVGSAMTAGFALNMEAADLDQGTEDIFVRRRSFKRPTWPRYALLDHKVFDAALAAAYGADTLIEDCWKPFAAVAADLSDPGLALIRTGLLWHAVRASSAIPGVLPPLFTADGTMLVDGGLVDNAPLAPMQGLKAGPNLVVHFGETACVRYQVAYDELPGRSDVLGRLLWPFRKRRWPEAPGAVSVLARSLMARQRYASLPVTDSDLVLRPPPFPGSSLLNFDRHTEVMQAARDWAAERINALEAAGDPAVTALLGAKPAPG